MSAAVFLLLVAEVGLSVAVVEDVDPPTLARVVSAVEEAAKTSTTAAIVRRQDCDGSTECETAPGATIRLRVFGSPTLIRVTAVLRRGDGATLEARQDIERRALEAMSFQKLATALFPPRPPPPPPPPVVKTLPAAPSPVLLPTVVFEPASEPSSSVVPWVLAGGALATGVGALGFGLSSRSASADLEGAVNTAAIADARIGRQHDHGLVANVLIGTSAAMAVAAIIWFVVE